MTPPILAAAVFFVHARAGERAAVRRPQILDGARERDGRGRAHNPAAAVIRAPRRRAAGRRARAVAHRHQQRPQPKRGGYEIGGFLSGERQRQQRRRDVQPADAPLVEVAPHADDQAERPHRHQNVVAREAAEVEHRRRRRQPSRRQQRSETSETAPQQKRHPNQDGAHHGVQQPRSGVRVAERQKQRRVRLELKRPVHHRVVLVAVARYQLPRIERVETLVVMQRARAEVPQPHSQADRD